MSKQLFYHWSFYQKPTDRRITSKADPTISSTKSDADSSNKTSTSTSPVIVQLQVINMKVRAAFNAKTYADNENQSQILIKINNLEVLMLIE